MICAAGWWLHQHRGKWWDRELDHGPHLLLLLPEASDHGSLRHNPQAWNGLQAGMSLCCDRTAKLPIPILHSLVSLAWTLLALSISMLGKVVGWIVMLSWDRACCIALSKLNQSSSLHLVIFTSSTHPLPPPTFHSADPPVLSFDSDWLVGNLSPQLHHC